MSLKRKSLYDQELWFFLSDFLLPGSPDIPQYSIPFPFPSKALRISWSSSEMDEMFLTSFSTTGSEFASISFESLDSPGSIRGTRYQYPTASLCLYQPPDLLIPAISLLAASLLCCWVVTDPFTSDFLKPAQIMNKNQEGCLTYLSVDIFLYYP
jgi:hypothetical protein